MITDPRKYVAWWLTKKKITIDERGSLCSPDKRDFFGLTDALILDYFQQLDEFNKVADKKIKGAPEANLRRALDEIISLEMLKRRAKTFELIKFNGIDNLTPLEQFVTAITGKTEKKVVLVLAHFLWQIKRRLEDRDVVYHIMPIIYGAQGGGKSVALQRLFKPLSNLTLDLSLTEITDSRFYYALNKNFVVVLDEMAGAKKADVEILKKQISATYNDVRKLGTNDVSKVKQNASFIGTTNRPVNELIFDPTGARRFYEIKALEKLDWETINNIDYMALYQGIDESRERGYIEEVIPEVIEDQKELIGVDELEAFMEEYKITPGEREVSVNALYDAYKLWAEVNGMRTLINSVWFGRKIRNRGIGSFVRKVKGKSSRIYLVSEECEIGKRSDTYDSLLGIKEDKKWN